MTIPENGYRIVLRTPVEGGRRVLAGSGSSYLRGGPPAGSCLHRQAGWEPVVTELTLARLRSSSRPIFRGKVFSVRLWEFRLEDSDEVPEVGAEITVETFAAGQKVDVAGKSKGKGFQGAVKRWNFSMQDATHGNSLSHRSAGSIGQCQTPGRVFKGKKMAGHMGDANVTTQGLEVVRVDSERNLLLIKGAVPGAPGGDVIIRPAVKA